MKLREWRKENRYSLPAFVRLLEDEGIRLTHQTLSNYETGKTEPASDFRAAVRKLTKGKVKPDSFKRAAG